jgi:hypothetical protein
MMPRAAEQRKDEVIEAADHGLTFSGQPYQVRNLGEIHVATDRARDSFASAEEYVRYVYENRYDRDKVRFVNEAQNNLYRDPKYQDKIAAEIAKQEGVDVSAPPATFREEAQQEEFTTERAEAPVQETPREETAIFRASFFGRPVRFEMDVSNMSETDREFLRGSIDGLGRASAGNMDYTFSTFIDNFKDRIKGLSMEFTDENLNRSWGAVPMEGNGSDIVAEMRRLSGRA